MSEPDLKSAESMPFYLTYIYFSCSLWQLTVKIISLYFEGMNWYNNMHELICKLIKVVSEGRSRDLFSRY